MVAMSHLTDTPPLPLSHPLQCADEFARREPTKALVSALGAGFLLNLLPLGAIASGVTRIAFASVRPTLLVLGLMKACELCNNHKTITDHHE